MSALLSIRGLVAAYGNIEALKGVDLDINPGEIVALIGSNGAGKSTLMMSVFGRPRARAGLITFDGRDITFEPTHHVARLRIAQSPEGRRIFPRMTVAENLRMGADAAAESTEAERSEDLEKVFTLFPRLKERIAQRGGTLSGGEQQMLAIGRGLMAEPELLVLDEPSLGLSPLLVEEMFGLIQALNRDGLSILLVEQNVVQSLAIANRAFVLEHGRIALSGAAADLLNDPGLKASYLGI